MRVVKRAFTLVEILIVVVILGILASIVVPLFASTVDDSALNVTLSELTKVRRHVEVYQVRNGGQLPAVTAGDGTWGPLVSADHFQQAPANPWIGGANAKRIILGTAADTAYHTNYGWIYNSATGDVWAGGFDANDSPFPR